MQHTEPILSLSALGRLWSGFRHTFLEWSPPPSQVVSWHITERYPRVAAVIRSDHAHWLLVLAIFGLGVALRQSEFGPSAATVVGGVALAAPVVIARRDLLMGWRVGIVILGLAAGVSASGFQVAAGIQAAVLTALVSLRYERSVAMWAWTAMAAMSALVAGAALPLYVVMGGLLALLTDTLRTRRIGSDALVGERRRAGVERARRIGVEERTRVARELHDVVAHHMSTVAVRAETAPYRIEGLSEQAKAEFAEISQAARESLNEIRGLLGVLRSDDAPRLPQPGLDQLEDMVESSRRAGVDVELTVSGHQRPLRAAVELAAYRIIQESLSNVARHGFGAKAELWVEFGDDELGLVVANSCPTPVGEPGHGITGMTERAAAVGGTVDARRRPDGRFVVEALLPAES